MKKKAFIRTLATLMAALTLLTGLPLGVFAVGDSEELVSQQTENGSSEQSEQTTVGKDLPVYQLDYVSFSNEDEKGVKKFLYQRDSDTFIIEGPSALVDFCNQVNAGAYFSDKTIILENNIDFEGREFLPIGTTELPFVGNFDGANHEIYNIRISLPTDPTVIREDSVGFFGAIRNATVKNFGITGYTIDHKVSFLSDIGTLIGRMENSEVTNCYANGNLNVQYVDSNPLERNDVIRLDSVPESLKYTSADSRYYGQGVIIDLRGISDTYINKNLVIGGDVSALRLVGDPNKSYSGLSIVIEDHADFPFMLELCNVKMAGYGTNGLISCKYDRDIYINSVGDICNRIAATLQTKGIYAPGSTVIIMGTADLSVSGSKGNNGLDGILSGNTGWSGYNGDPGHVGISAEKLIVMTDSKVSVSGGNGGNGGNGSDGKDGADGRPGVGAWDTGYDGGDGEKGQAGGNGGNGGAGGNPLDVKEMYVYSGTCALVTGKPGNGGNGGAGGDGGNGGNGGICEMYKWVIDGSRMKGINAGDGAIGGVGGNGGSSGKCPTAVTADMICRTYDKNAVSIFTSGTGTYGEGGAAGKNGVGGTAGYKRAMKLFGGWGGKTYGSNGYSPQDTINPGFRGATVTTGIGGTITVTTDNSLVKPRIVMTKSGAAVGGFVGHEVYNTKIDMCAAVVNDLSVLDLGNNSHVGNFAALSKGEISNIISAKQTDGVLSAYPMTTWIGDKQDYTQSLEVSVLNEDLDAQGVWYDNGIGSDNTVLVKRSVIDYVDGRSQNKNVKVPAYVFSGRFIAAVTKIERYAFEDSDIESINTGELVTKICQKAFYNCSSLKSAVITDSVAEVEAGIFAECDDLVTVEIGHSLEKIPELENKQTPFGITKSNSDLKEYIVDPENKSFKTIDGILYETFSVKMPDGTANSIPVAVIDVPVDKEFENGEYYPADYIVKIYPYAFSYVSNLKTVHLDYIRDVGTGAFSNCKALKEAIFKNIPEETGVVKILDEEYLKASESYCASVGIKAFSGCTKLSHVNLEANTIEKIGVGAFENCATDIAAAPMDIIIGKNVKILGADDGELYGDVEYTVDEMMARSFASVFTNARVRSIDVCEGSEIFFSVNGVLFYRSGETVDGTDIESVWLAAYPQYKTDETYSVTSSAENGYIITYISPDAFSKAVYLSELSIGEGVEHIGDRAFQGLIDLHVLSIGKDVRSLGNKVSEAFTGCITLERIEVDGENESFCDVDGVLLSKDKTEIIKYPASKSGSEYDVPESVKVIAAKAFSENKLLRCVSIKGEISFVGDSAFELCPNLIFICFEKGDAPFDTPKEMKDSAAFYTGNPRVMVCFMEETETWLELEKHKYVSESQSQAGVHPTLFTVAKYTAYPTDFENQGYYAFVVVDKSGALLNNINVKLEDSSSTNAINTINGISMFYGLDLDKAYALTVMDNMGQYFPIINSEFYLDKETRITYVTLSSVPTVSGINASYTVESQDKIKDILSDDAEVAVIGDGDNVVDINSETAKINKWCVNSVKIKISCGMDADVNVLHYYLIQNDTQVKCNGVTVTYSELGGKKFAYVEFDVSTSELLVESDLYAVVKFSDGSSVQSKLQIHIFEMNMFMIDLSWLNDDWSIPVSGDLQKILKGFESSLDFAPGKDGKKDHFYFVVEVEEDTFKVAIGYEAKKEKEFEGTSSMMDDLKDVFKNWNNFKSTLKNNFDKQIELTHERSLEFALCGFLEIKYEGIDENQHPDVEISSGIYGSLKLEYNVGTTISALILPIRVEVDMSIEGKLALSFYFDDRWVDGQLPTFKGWDLTFELNAQLAIHAGIGCKLVSAGVYGSAEMVFVLEIIPEFQLQKWTLSGDVGLYIKYDGLFVKWKKTWSFLDGYGSAGEWVIFEDGKWWNQRGKEKVAISDLNMAAAVYNEANYQIAASTYSFAENFKLYGINEMSESAYSAFEARSVRVGDLIYYFYYGDLNGYSDLYDEFNYQKIVYQTYNTKTEQYSEVRVLDDNSYADGAFEVYGDAGKVYIAYTQLDGRIDEDLADEENAEAIEQYLGLHEVKTAVIDENGDVKLGGAITDDEYYDMHVRIGKIGSKIVAVYVQNRENTMFATTKNNSLSIMYSTLEGDTWSEPRELAGGIGTVTDIEISDDGIAYLTDRNNDLLTVSTADGDKEGYNDRGAVALSLDKNIVGMTSKDGAYYDLCSIDGRLAYYCDENIYYLDTEKAIFDEKIPGLTEKYSLLYDSDGALKAILFVKNTAKDTVENGEGEAECSNVYGIFQSGGIWGAPIQLTHLGTGEFVTSFEATDMGASAIFTVLVTEREYVGDVESEAYNTYDSVRVMNVDYPTDHVLTEVGANIENIEPGKVHTVKVHIQNNGYQALGSATVTVKRNGSVIATVAVTKFIDENGNRLEGGIPSGKGAYAYVEFAPGSVPSIDEAKDDIYTFECGEGSVDKILWYSDFAVYGKQVLIGGVYYAVVRVVNDGHVGGSYTLTLSHSGYDRTAFVELDPGESRYFTFALDNNKLSELVKVSVNAEGEYITTNNEALVNVSTDEEKEIDLSVYVSTNKVTLDRSALSDVVISFENVCDLVGVYLGDKALDPSLYTVDNTAKTLTLHAEKLAAAYENGNLGLKLEFVGASSDILYASVSVKLTQTFLVSWVVDGDTVKEELLEAGAAPQFGSDPEKQSDGMFSYTFVGWDADGDGICDEVVSVDKNTAFTAVFEAKELSYEITWIVNGQTTVKESYAFGDAPLFKGTPAKESDERYDYTFIGWDKEITTVSGNATYTAVYEASLRKYTVTFVSGNGQTQILVEYGQIPVIADPVKESDERYDYTFTGWYPELSPVYGEKTYTAIFGSNLRKYTVTWIVNGKITEETYSYGELPEFGETPERAGDAQYSYRFTGWDNTVTAVVGDAAYTAEFEAILNTYTVTWVVADKVTKQEYSYGDMPAYGKEVPDYKDDSYRYRFAGWDSEISTVVGDITYTAQYESEIIGSAVATGSAFTPDENGYLTVTVSMKDIKNMDELTADLYYNRDIISVISYKLSDGVTLVSSEDGMLRLFVGGLDATDERELIHITFTTVSDADFAPDNVFYMESEENLVSAFSRESVYLKGDIDLDFDIDMADAVALVDHLSGNATIKNSISLKNAEMIPDGILDMDDAVKILEAAVKY